ncbi:MAG: hypothetical protein FWF40_02720 [Methanomassiliicoccaceae archaeon]|jgi:hypothetical protein|nr:hypothetical protein [Methanomassiliicoccaceae archaeon]
MTTLEDYHERGVPEPERFFAAYGKLKPEEYKAKIVETYGPAEGRDKRMEATVNAAVLAYVVKKA